MKADSKFDKVTDLALAAAPRPGRSADADSVAAAGLVHDLGNLIQLASSAIGILGRSPQLKEGHLASVVVSAKASLERAGRLVRQTLGRAADRPIPAARLDACLAEVEESMRAALRSGLMLDLRLEPDLPSVACDPLGLQCALLNLLFNAREAMAGRGTIRMRAKRIADEGTAMVEIRISDSGVGMSPETIERALDPFFTTKSDGLGGIGLPMVDRFAREWGGEIEIRSELRRGTTVFLRLPLLDRTRMAAPERELDR